MILNNYVGFGFFIFGLVRLIGTVQQNVFRPQFSNQGQASGMDGTLTLIFAISETIRDIKKFI